MSNGTGVKLEAVFQHKPDSPRIPCRLTGRRKIAGEWCYLADFGKGTPQWIPAKQFTDFGGDPQRLFNHAE